VSRLDELVESASASRSCERCGSPMAVVLGWAMPCATCRVAMAREHEERAAQERAEAEQGRRLQRAKRWAASVPERFQWALDPSPEQLERVPTPVRARIDTLTHPATRAMVGPAGSGKSSAAAILVTRWARAGVACRWLSARAVDEAAREAKLGAALPQALAQARSVDVLVLDDVGTEGTIGLEELVRLVHSRHDDDLVTVSTTGLSRAQIAARYGDGIARRLLEAGVIQVPGGRNGVTGVGLS